MGDLILKYRNMGGKTFSIYGDPEDRSVFVNIMNSGYYEDHMIDFYKELLKEDSVCIDAGANIGMISMYMSLFTKGKIYSFEPTVEVFDALQKNIEANNLNVQAFNVALGDKNGEYDFIHASTFNGANAFFVENPDRPKFDSNTTIIKTKAIRIDDFVKEHNIDKLDVLKMDVEGFEILIVKGAEETIKRFDPDIVSEFAPHMIRDRNIDPKIYFDFLKSYYKHIYLIDHPVMRLISIDNYDQLEKLLPHKKIGDIFLTNKSL